MRDVNYEKHREIWRQHYLNIPKGYHIHHIDGDHFNNNILNLQCLTPKQHGTRHRGARGKTIARVYGTQFEDYDLIIMSDIPPLLRNKKFTYNEIKKYLKENE